PHFEFFWGGGWKIHFCLLQKPSAYVSCSPAAILSRKYSLPKGLYIQTGRMIHIPYCDLLRDRSQKKPPACAHTPLTNARLYSNGPF
ncbi:MAG: hypothetical protein ACLUYS_06825, partial [Allobaculum sp.]|uniref:hypothetical protein n=1 Tax=Allobaculum sp. TaxID=1872463 RepID=UPI00399B99BC